MTPMKKTILAIVIAAAIILGGYATYAMYTTNGWADGAPEADIVCSIGAVNDGTDFGGTATVGEDTDIGSTHAFTTFTSNIPTLDANTQYSISFAATITTKTAKFGEALTNSISVTGTTGGSASGQTYLATGDIASSSASVAGTAGSSSTLSIPGFVKRTTASTPMVIMGDVIDSSEFTFTITSTATDGRTSSTTATLGIDVANGGTIYVTVNSISTTVVASVYPEGWNVPGNTNYIVCTASGFTISYHSQTNNIDLVASKESYQDMRDYLLTKKNTLAITEIQYICGIAQITALGG